jgi:hypothetical protein
MFAPQSTKCIPGRKSRRSIFSVSLSYNPHAMQQSGYVDRSSESVMGPGATNRPRHCARGTNPRAIRTRRYPPRCVGATREYAFSAPNAHFPRRFIPSLPLAASHLPAR